MDPVVLKLVIAQAMVPDPDVLAILAEGTAVAVDAIMCGAEDAETLTAQLNALQQPHEGSVNVQVQDALERSARLVQEQANAYDFYDPWPKPPSLWRLNAIARGLASLDRDYQRLLSVQVNGRSIGESQEFCEAAMRIHNALVDILKAVSELYRFETEQSPTWGGHQGRAA